MSQQTPLPSFTFPFIGAKSDVGQVRQINEDNFWVPPLDWNPDLLATRGYLLIVADGMGGHVRGEEASRLTVKGIVEMYYGDTNPNLRESFRNALRRTNLQVFSAGQAPEQYGMGATVVAVIVKDNHALFVNAGDSRGYLISKGQVQLKSQDHSQVQELVDSGLISDQQARNHPFKNVITRAVGLEADIQPHEADYVLEQGDSILLCSDGLSNLVPEEKIADMITMYPPMEAAQRMVALAKELGGPDNITAVIMRIELPPSAIQSTPFGVIDTVETPTLTSIQVDTVIIPTLPIVQPDVAETPTLPSVQQDTVETPTLPSVQIEPMVDAAQVATVISRKPDRTVYAWPLLLGILGGLLLLAVIALIIFLLNVNPLSPFGGGAPTVTPPRPSPAVVVPITIAPQATRLPAGVDSGAPSTAPVVATTVVPP